MHYSALQDDGLPMASLSPEGMLTDIEQLGEVAQSPFAGRNPCAELDEKSKSRLSHDAFHLNPADHGCSQICMPNALHFVAKLHGVDYGNTCPQMGFTSSTDDGWDHGIHFFNYVEPGF
mmetsp:Transcript_22137/g.56093  ORF Transcript_22137/g.56093 Transcript_22137/m.56093 type:complete len:119 (-) Transcript_22137:212-568(-)